MSKQEANRSEGLSHEDIIKLELARTDASINTLKPTIDALTKPIDELNSQIAALVEKRRPMVEQRAILFQGLKALEQKRGELIERQNELQKRQAIEVKAKLMVAQFHETSEGLQTLDNPVALGMARVLKAIASDGRFTEALPYLLEGVIKTKYNDERINVKTQADNCRVALLEDGDFAVLYSPKPTVQGDTHALFEQMEFFTPKPEGELNRHVLGVRVENFEVQPFVLFQTPHSRDHVESVDVVAPRELLEPLYNKIGGILSEGDIFLPKSFGKVVIKS